MFDFYYGLKMLPKWLFPPSWIEMVKLTLLGLNVEGIYFHFIIKIHIFLSIVLELLNHFVRWPCDEEVRYTNYW